MHYKSTLQLSLLCCLASTNPKYFRNSSTLIPATVAFVLVTVVVVVVVAVVAIVVALLLQF